MEQDSLRLNGYQNVKSPLSPLSERDKGDFFVSDSKQGV